MLGCRCNGIAIANIDLNWASCIVQVAQKSDAKTRVIGLFSDLRYFDAADVELHAVIAFDATNFLECRMHQWLFGQSKSQQIDVACWPQRKIKPYVKQQRAFEQEVGFVQQSRAYRYR